MCPRQRYALLALTRGINPAVFLPALVLHTAATAINLCFFREFRVLTPLAPLLVPTPLPVPSRPGRRAACLDAAGPAAGSHASVGPVSSRLTSRTSCFNILSSPLRALRVKTRALCLFFYLAACDVATLTRLFSEPPASPSRCRSTKALTPNLLARTIETVEGGGLVILLLKTVTSLKQLYAMSMDVHSR